MTEAEKIALSEPLAEIFMSMEDDLLRAIARQIALGGEINATSEWKMLKLAQEGALTAEAVRVIQSYIGDQSGELTRAISEAALNVIDTLEPAFHKCALDGFVSDASEIPMSAMSAKIISTYRKQAATDLNLVNTVMMYKTGSRYKELVNKIYDEANRQEYLNALGKHTASVVTGAESRQAAVRNCIREFAEKGIPAFVDKAGREWSPEAYINMDIRTTVSNTASAAQDAVCDKYGVDLIAVSSHMGARPKCAPYQGKIFSRGNKSGVTHDGNGREIPYAPLSSTSYGQPDGLFGINRRHQKYPFVDGVNFQTYYPYDEAENAKRYKEFQTQRAMERDIRRKKRECMMFEETGDTEALKAARADLRQSKKAYAAYSDEHGLRVKEDRLRVERSKGKNAESIKSVQIDTEHTQNFRPLNFDGQANIKRGNVDITLNHVSTAANNIYLSESSQINAKTLHEIDVKISKSKNKMRITSSEGFPDIYVITHDEMAKNAIASYNPITNVMCIDEKFGYKNVLSALQKDGACPDNELSTVVHELFHWKDAQEYIKYHGAITYENYDNYIRHLNISRKKLLDKYGINEYNVNNISAYADQSYCVQDYDEVFTELRVLFLFKE